MLEARDVARIVVCLAILLSSSSSSAEVQRMRAMLLDFEGPSAVRVRGNVMKLVAKRFWVTSATKIEGKNFRYYTQAYEIDLVVEGVVERRRVGHVLRLKFRSGHTGGVLRTSVANLANGRIDHLTERRIEREIEQLDAVLRPVHEE